MKITCTQHVLCLHMHMSEYIRLLCNYNAIKITISFSSTPSPVVDTEDVINIVIPVSVAVVVVIIAAIVVSLATAKIIMIKYKHSKLTTNPTQSDSPQEPSSSRCVREWVCQFNEC